MTIDFKQLQVSPQAHLLDAIRIIDKGAAQIALVVDENERLVGTLTDGDIRRGLLHGETLDTHVEKLMNRQFHCAGVDASDSDILKIMRQEVLRQIPVIDAQGRIKRLFLQQELATEAVFHNAVVLMAGGKGTRLRPHTENCPKPMLLVDDKPMLEILLEQFISSGFSKFYFSVNYLKEQIIDYFGDGASWGVSIKYLIEDKPLGTAGSLQLIPDNLKEPFLVANGDVLTKLDPARLIDFHVSNDSAATLCVREHVTNIPFGVVQTNGVELAGFQEKPSYRQLVNAGVYVVDPCVLPVLPQDQFTDMPTLLEAAQAAGHKITVCPIHEYWIDVGRPETLLQASKEWASCDLQ
tara:strand:- start:377 stop:1432 length:1056 start_codon:yes stop_codon:yes gene_type:complete